jgi:hypothetical protein
MKSFSKDNKDTKRKKKKEYILIVKEVLALIATIKVISKGFIK